MLSTMEDHTEAMLNVQSSSTFEPELRDHDAASARVSPPTAPPPPPPPAPPAGSNNVIQSGDSVKRLVLAHLQNMDTSDFDLDIITKQLITR